MQTSKILSCKTRILFFVILKTRFLLSLLHKDHSKWEDFYKIGKSLQVNCPV